MVTVTACHISHSAEQGAERGGREGETRESSRVGSSLPGGAAYPPTPLSRTKRDRHNTAEEGIKRLREREERGGGGGRGFSWKNTFRLLLPPLLFSLHLPFHIILFSPVAEKLGAASLSSLCTGGAAVGGKGEEEGGGF